MNAFLAQFFSWLVALTGLIIIGSGAFISIAVLNGEDAPFYSGDIEGAVLASLIFLGSLFIAVLTCGFLAVVCEIERHLRGLRELEDTKVKRLIEANKKSEPKLYGEG